ncbi:putative regulator of chromosome condensation protein [Diplogelasinospora grovesii]|uniref:Regulator of chromosome condensation protein n=1 Tax=Diplogelasinospora grovesii TaxID=303347 RepID=A0AAN6SA79_9PEZI|nr:putative regulator of chromosome condensation protein [Diplogelasinospora grovesii]
METRARKEVINHRRAALDKKAAESKKAEEAAAEKAEKAATTASKKAATTASKKAAAAESKKATATATATKKAPAATKKAATSAPKKATASAPKKKAASASKDESDKENAKSQPKMNGKVNGKVNGAKRKRAAEEEEEEEEEEDKEEHAEDEEEEKKKKAPAKKATRPAPKRAKTDEKDEAKAEAEAKPAKKPRERVHYLPTRRVPTQKPINDVPKQLLDVFVFGEGGNGELGLGAHRNEGKMPIDVKRPRLNKNLQNVVQVACGGMHAAVLTKDNKILTWGVNDLGALGRPTEWDGGLKDVDADDDDKSDVDDSGLNPLESTPDEIDTRHVPDRVVWAQIVAADSATFALTHTGLVYGWGTFRGNDGVIGFSKDVKVQKTPVLINDLTKIKQLAAGSDHILAVDEKNKVYAWGSGQQCQLARKLVDRDSGASLTPAGVGMLPGRAKVAKLACGAFHSFVLDTKGRVIAWGLNNYGELGLDTEVGQDGGTSLRPQIVTSLEDYEIADIAGGSHHSLACTTDGKVLAWGRIDGHQLGLDDDVYNEDNAVFDENGKPRILLQPLVVPGIEGKVVSVAAGTDNSFAVTEDGKVYSWGFSATYQTGQGTQDDIEEPTVIDNSAIRGKKIVWAGSGAQYSIVAAARVETDGDAMDESK